MAKISKVNVAITGDSSGLQKAGDQAQAKMRAIRAQADATGRSLGGMRGQANQLAESLTKLGVGGRALQGVGAIAGLGQLGIGAAMMGPTGIAFAGVAAAAVSVNALADSYAQLRADAKAADQAMKSGAQTAEQWRKLGFTREGGTALAAYSRQMGAEPIGFGRAFTQAQALAGGGRSNLQNFFEYGPGALGSVLGTLLAGDLPTSRTIGESIGQEESQSFGRSLQMFGGLASGANPVTSAPVQGFIAAQTMLEQLGKLFSR
jgi:hypothetical protein